MITAFSRKTIDIFQTDLFYRINNNKNARFVFCILKLDSELIKRVVSYAQHKRTGAATT